MKLTDAEFSALCREHQVAGFLNLRKLLPSDIAAVKALRAETALVSSPEYRALNAPQNEEFASMVRVHMLSEKLEWTTENLLLAVKHVLASLSQPL